MKKILFTLSAIAAITLTSCDKEFTCTCTQYVDGVEVNSFSKTFKGNESVAEVGCEALSIEVVDGAGNECELD